MSFYIYETQYVKEEIEMTETNAERLERAHRLLSALCEMGDGVGEHGRDVELVQWLIEQAERVQELELYCEKSANFINQIELEKENKRLREALEELRNLSMSVRTQYEEDGSIVDDADNHFLYDFTTKALEGVSNDENKT